MTVERQELEELQIYVQKNLRKLSSSPEPDSASLFDLQNMDSNISFILSSADMQHTDIIELGTKDRSVKDFLLRYRKENLSQEGAGQFITDVAFNATEALNSVNSALGLLKDCGEPVLKKNLEKALDMAGQALNQIVSLKDSPKKLKTWSVLPVTEEDVIKPARKSSRTTASEAKAPAKTVSKPAAAKSAVKSPSRLIRSSSRKETAAKK